MTEFERYLFDLRGFLVAPGVLSTDEVAELKALLDARSPWDEEPVKDKQHLGPLLEWGEPFLRLVWQPTMIAYLREMIGEGLRLDHEYAIFMKAGAGRLRLHGGGTPYDHAQFYHWRNERMYNGLVVAQFALSDAGGDHGGFCAIPGSHKANLRTPAEVRDLEHLELTREAGLVCPPVKTGDLILFTEALTHGTLPWTPDFERRALLYKFSPGHQSWSKRHRPAPEGAELTEEQARLFRPPYHGRREPVFEDAAPAVDPYAKG